MVAAHCSSCASPCKKKISREGAKAAKKTAPSFAVFASLRGTFLTSARVSSDLAYVILELEETMMNRRFLSVMLLALCLLAAVVNVHAQDSNPAQTVTKQADTKDDETNLETQLYLIVGTNGDVPDAKLPAALDTVVRQLHAALPFKNYRLAATMINRVKNEGRLELRWIGGPLTLAAGPAPALNPSFSNFFVRQVKLVQGSDGQPRVQMQGFNFGARVPIQVSGAIAANGAVAPTINYEPTGVSTDVSMREGEPVIVGTLNIGPSGDAIILVVSAKRTMK